MEPEAATALNLAKRSVVVGGHRTSVSLEPPFWKALSRMAAERGASINALVTAIDHERGAGPDTRGLSSTLRIAVLEWALAQNPPNADCPEDKRY